MAFECMQNLSISYFLPFPSGWTTSSAEAEHIILYHQK